MNTDKIPLNIILNEILTKDRAQQVGLKIIDYLKSEALNHDISAIQTLYNLSLYSTLALEWIWDGRNYELQSGKDDLHNSQKEVMKRIASVKSLWPITYHCVPQQREIVENMMKDLDIGSKAPYDQRKIRKNDYIIFLIKLLRVQILPWGPGGPWENKTIEEWVDHGVGYLKKTYPNLLKSVNEHEEYIEKETQRATKRLKDKQIKLEKKKSPSTMTEIGEIYFMANLEKKVEARKYVQSDLDELKLLKEKILKRLKPLINI
jgi:hypothetical protein